MRRLRFAIQPGWLALHAVTVALIVTMVLLGRWQLTVSEDKGFSLQNFGYALQWWAFSCFVFLMWARAMRDAIRKQRPAAGNAVDIATDEAPAEVARPVEQPVTYRRYVMPTSVPPETDNADPLHAAYNDFLLRLAADDLADNER